ncbi:NucA/NucB deoxyribonuclease domain-containing protein [Paenibacillus wynnii]|uniref:NucA/NucB deoxyribonuclease domain-containing protein n=1 Tax=Paenibacillus wynnii TaxID=268407 RepID=UPI00278DC01C|nr:NucA/NucB deoxyribonuclease domain-containing protein [Paenibacillus wynnii]MDQ0196281.1 hypothetical protein [Paenibacillus wynnii]
MSKNVQNTVAKVASGASKAATQVSAAVNKVASQVPAAVNKTLSSVKTVVASAATDVRQAAASTVNNVKLTAVTVSKNVQNAVTNVASGASKMATQVSAVISKTVTQVAKQVAPTVNKTLSSVKQVVASAATEVRQAAASTVNTVKITAVTVSKNVQNTVTNMASGVSKAATNASATVSKTVNSAVNAVSEKAKKINVADTVNGFQTGLDVAGLIPGAGELADGANALIYMAKGEKANAALSAAAMIPGIGSIGTVGKLVGKGKGLLDEGVSMAAHLGDDVRAVNKGKGKIDCPECTISRGKYPESAQHIEDAIKNGQPDTLTINRGGAKSNRRDSLKGLEKVQGKDLDEYPPAMFGEGGKGASVRPISPSDNRGAGSSMGHKLRQYPDGTKIRIKIRIRIKIDD